MNLMPNKRQIRRAFAHALMLAGTIGATSPAFASPNPPNFVFGSNLGQALDAYSENPESLSCTLDNQNIKVGVLSLYSVYSDTVCSVQSTVYNSIQYLE